MYNQGLIDAQTGTSNAVSDIKKKLNEIEDKINDLQKIVNLKKFNSKQNKKQICDFIKEKFPNTINVISVIIKEEDDKNGFANEHYIVECAVRHLDPTHTSAFRDVNKICLVNVLEYQKWLKSKNAIKWI